MVQDIDLPLSVLNEVIGVSGVDDITLPFGDLVGDVLEEFLPFLEPILTNTDEIRNRVEALQDDIDDLDDLDQTVQDAVDDLDLDVDLPDVPDLEDIGDEVRDAIRDELGEVTADNLQLSVDGSLFSLATDFADLLAESLDVADLQDVGQFPTLEEIEEVVPDAPEVDVPEPDSILPEGVGDLQSFLDGLPGGDLLLDPDSFVDSQLARLERQLVDPELIEELEQLLEETD